jgi:hypothetical protein
MKSRFRSQRTRLSTCAFVLLNSFFPSFFVESIPFQILAGASPGGFFKLKRNKPGSNESEALKRADSVRAVTADKFVEVLRKTQIFDVNVAVTPEDMEYMTPNIRPKHHSMPQNEMPYTGDFTNGALWRFMRLCNLAVQKHQHYTVIFDAILFISKLAFGFRSLIFP